MKKRGRLTILFTLLGLLAIIIIPSLAAAQTQISTAIPGSNSNASSTATPGAFVANFYQFALLIGGLLAFGVVVYGGIRYITSAGNPSGQSDAKEWIWGALLGLLLLGGAYFILKVINPQLVNLNLPTLQNTNTQGPAFVSSTPAGPGGNACQAPNTGPCMPSNLQNTCLSSNAALFGGICGHESGGAATIKSGTDYCSGPNGQKESVSVGLFQINITNSWKQTVDGQNCSAAFSGQAIRCSGNGPCTNSAGTACQVTNMTLYNDCVAAAQNPTDNITDACQLSSNGTNLGPWKADASACGY